ncbi:MAG: DNA polymerase III subunit gamma/tau [Lachnospiraceae bacterium]|nr:DNA polymerase III subunit gamma/tau [Lachnospiraceae bacterium]
MSYQALYRKFRPDDFSSVKGQEPIVTTLKNQLGSGRIGHAYLFCGTRGTGKTTIAKIMAKAVNCEDLQDGNPCGQCSMCRSIAAGTGMNVIEMDAASNNSVDDIRRIVEEVSYSPAQGRYKVYIIDEVHMLSGSAFNALLKTLEEPPSYVIFILATTEAGKIPITVLSRCQRYDFKRISIDTITDRLRELTDKEGIEAEDKALRYVARLADGSMRDGLSLLEQCIAFNFGKTLTYDRALDVLGSVDASVLSQLFKAMAARDVTKALIVVHDIMMQGREIGQFVSDLIWYLRSLLLLRCSDDIEDVVDVSSDNLQAMKLEAQIADENELMRYIRIFSELQSQLRFATAKRVLLEMAVIRICRPQMEAKNDALLSRIKALEDKLANGVMYEALPGNTATGQAPAESFAGTKEDDKEKIKSLVRALPEDIKEVVSRWGEIRMNTPQPMKTYLGPARISAADNELILALPDGTESDYFTKDKDGEGKNEKVKELEQIIAAKTGKGVTVRVRVIHDEKEEDRLYPDLQKFVNMTVEEGGDDSDPLDE